MTNRSRGPEFPANRLLALLPHAERTRLSKRLEPVAMEYRKLLYGSKKPLNSVYFLETGVASLVNTMKNGDAAEVGTIGNEGIVGLPIILGDTTAPTSVYVQVPGTALRMPAGVFREEFNRSKAMRTVMLHYAHAFFNQVAQSAACNRFHPIDQRCSRWLLMTRERMPSDEFLLTQEFLAMMLGVRSRPGLTNAMGKLKKAGLISYTRGIVKILDHVGLQTRSCECYAVTKAEFDRLLGKRRRAAVANTASRVRY
jgi:CRP-like cAMP-binding protein